MGVAVRLRDGLYRYGKRVLTYRQLTLRAARKGLRTLKIIEPMTGNLVDYLDLYMAH